MAEAFSVKIETNQPRIPKITVESSVANADFVHGPFFKIFSGLNEFSITATYKKNIVKIKNIIIKP